MTQIFGYLNKLNLADFSKPSVLWGIDGDWIVNYIPAGEMFFPTDHCGVLRSNNETTNTYYVSLIMDVIGNKHNFSRSYRASIDRVRGLEIPYPPKKIQDKVAKECEPIETKYKSSRMTMEEYREKIMHVLLMNKVIIEE
ncbi:MAG: restriction endonuclease subunit S [Bacteroidales bacterium]|nr:restriction endonuclease subunit S [Bacteroidales bacterium]